jgi:protein-tyrosine phosphatase
MRVLFVCLGNICRSPAAEGVMRQLLVEAGLDHAVVVDSAGVGTWHIGQRADARSRAAAARRGIELTSVARQVTEADLDDFDLVLAADVKNRGALLQLAGADPDRRRKIKLLREFDPNADPDDLDIADPYYGGQRGFDVMFGQIDEACRGLLDKLRADGVA